MAIEETVKHGNRIEAAKNDDVLDLLEREDLELGGLFTAVEEARGDTVRGRAAYGDAAKDIIQHLATREAALVEISRKIADAPELGATLTALDAGSSSRRALLDELEKMSRGVQGINLNTGQDFDGVLQRVIETVGPDMERDRAESIPAVRAWLAQSDDHESLQGAEHVIRHAPTSLSPRGPRWYERAPVVSRFLTMYDRLRDAPRASRKH